MTPRTTAPTASPDERQRSEAGALIFRLVSGYDAAAGVNLMAASPEIAAGRADIAAIAAEIFATLGTAGQVTPFTSRPAGLSIDDAYRVSAALHAMREARGEKPRGREIGFTNRTIWHQYGTTPVRHRYDDGLLDKRPLFSYKPRNLAH